MRKVKAFSALLLAAPWAYADFTIPSMPTLESNPLALHDAALARAGLTQNKDDITDDQDENLVSLTKEHLHEAQVWNLTPEEEKRYVLLMQNRSSIYYQGLRLTPVDILGINARNEHERRHFAELAALQEAQKVARNIAWNNAFHQASITLFAKIPVVGNFDPAPYSPYAQEAIQLNQGDTLYFFIKPTDAVTTILLLLTEAIEKTPNTTVHIMLLNVDDLGIQLWANQHQIPQSLVASGVLTLNHGELHYQSLEGAQKQTPLLLLARDGHANRVDLGRF